MVDGRYYARGDRTTRRLTDAEEVQYHSQRANQENRVASLLGEEILRDPWKPGEADNGHFFIVAEPLVGRHDLMISLTCWPLRARQPA